MCDFETSESFIVVSACLLAQILKRKKIGKKKINFNISTGLCERKQGYLERPILLHIVFMLSMEDMHSCKLMHHKICNGRLMH